MAENAIVKFTSRFIRTTDQFDGDRFFTLQDGVKVRCRAVRCSVVQAALVPLLRPSHRLTRPFSLVVCAPALHAVCDPVAAVLGVRGVE